MRWSARTLLATGVEFLVASTGRFTIWTGRNLKRGFPFAFGGNVSVPLRVGFVGFGRLKIISAASPEECKVPRRYMGPVTSPANQYIFPTS